jgi:hypothetical protein
MTDCQRIMAYKLQKESNTSNKILNNSETEKNPSLKERLCYVYCSLYHKN